MRKREAWLTVLGGVLVAVATAVYRFCLLGGQFGGFENDEYLVISRASAMLRGELPSRDFVDPGYPLAYVASALSMHAAGGVLLGHALLAVGMLALGAALTYAVGVAASGSRTVGILVAVIQLALGPRLYNYPKVVLYALAVLGWWAYVDRRSPARLAALAVLTAVAFLFRHDHGAYIGLGTVVMLAVLAREAGVRSTAGRMAGYGAATAVCLAPYFVFLQMNGGIVEHFRAGAEFSRVDQGRTQLRWPAFAIDGAAPLLALGAPPAVAPARIKVRWRAPAPATAEQVAFARDHGLTLHGPAGVEGAEFDVIDESAKNLQAVVRDARVADTQNIDRTAWRLRERPVLGLWDRMRRSAPWLRVRIAPGVVRAENAAPFVYYLWLALPVIAAVIGAYRLWTQGDVQAWRAVYRLSPVVVVMVLLDQWFLRGTLPVRLADVSVLAAGVGAWELQAAASALRSRQSAVRMICAAVLAAVILGTTVSAFAIGRVISNLGVVTNGDGLGGVAPRAEAVAEELATPGPVLAARRAATSPTLRLADYLHSCLDASQRALVIAYLPEVFYFADRPFAGGQVEIRAGYLASPREQQLTVERLRRQDAPLVVTEPRDVFEERYREESKLLLAYLDAAYRDTGDYDFGGQAFHVLVRRDVPARGVYDAVGAPCVRQPEGAGH